MPPRTSFALVCGVLVALSVACGKGRREEVEVVVPSLERALEALDAGDFARAEQILLERHRSLPSEKGLLEAVRRSELRGGHESSLLANLRATVVPRPPFEPPAKTNPPTCAACPRIARRAKTEPGSVPDVLAALGDPLYATRGARGLAEHLAGKSAIAPTLSRALPRSYGGERLVMALPQSDDRWLLLFGKDIGKARYVVVVDPRSSADPGRRVVAFDFQNFLEPPETIVPRDTYEAITWAELREDRLFVANNHAGNPEDSHGKNAYLTVIDVNSNAIIWRSAGHVANGGSFVVTDRHVICAYEDFEYMRLFTLDSETGRTVGSLALPVPARALWVQAGRLMARALDDELTFTGVPGLRDSLIGEARQPAIARLAGLAPKASLPVFSLEPAQAQKRATAVARLDQERPFEASKILRGLVGSDGLAGNIAVQTLLETAEKNLETARAGSVETVQRAPVVRVVKGAGGRAAPIERGPALRLDKVSEAKDLPVRGPSIFDQRGIAPAEIDRPYPGHVGDLPEYVPDKLNTAPLFGARYASSSKVLVAVYSGVTVLFDTERRVPESRLDFGALGAPSEWPQITRLELEGNVVIAAGRGTSPWLTAFDRRTGEAYWTSALQIDDMLLIDGWIVAITPSAAPGRGSATDVVVVDATTGVVASRLHSVCIDAIARQGNEIIGGATTSRVVLAMTRG